MKPKSALRSFLLGYGLLATSTAFAGSAAWNVDSDGNWADDINWNPASAPGATSGTASADVATLGIALTAPRIVTVDANRNLQGIDFTNLSGFGYTLSGGNLLLTNGGLIQTSGAGTAHTDTISSAIKIQGDGGTASFTAGSSTNTRLLVIGGGVTGVSTGLNVTTLTLNGGNTGANAVTGIIGDGSGGGKLALTKSGAGLWSLSSPNTYSGGTTLSAGTVGISNATSFSSGAVTVSGTSRINATGGITYANDIAVNAALTMQNPAVGANSTATFSGVLSGASSITLPNSGANGIQGILYFSNTANTFTGNVVLSPSSSGDEHFRFNSIGDGGNFTFAKNGNRQLITYSGASDITFGTRTINIASTMTNYGTRQGLDGGGANPVSSFFSSGAGAVSFNSNMTMTSLTSDGVLYFNGTNTGNNTFAGTIGDPTGAGKLWIGKLGAGTWFLTNDNTYEGGTIIGNGILSVGKIANMANAQPLGKGATIQFAVGNGGTSGALVFTGSTNSTTDKQVVVGPLLDPNSAGSGSILNNGSGTLSFSNATFNQALASGTVARTLTLGGTNAGNNEIQGTIQNNAAGAALIAITKTGAGTWTLSGPNTYTGGTNVNGGVLLLSGANNLPATGTLAVGAGGTFSLADGTVRNTTAATLTLASGALLSFDWSSAGTVDNLAPTAPTTPAANASVGIVINPIGTPTGTGLPLLTGIVGSNLDNPNYFLANNTNFTATITKAAESVTIGGYSTATSLADAYWLGGQLVSAPGAMAFSDGTASNWASDAAGTSAGGVVPGGNTVNVIFGATGASNQAAVTTGANLNLASLTFNDSAAVTLAGSHTITLNSSSSTAAASGGALGTITNTGGGISAISVTSFANATNTISANLALGANQTWNIASGKTLAVSGTVSGPGFALTKAAAGTLTLSGANSYTGGTTISTGTIAANNSSALGTGSVSVAAGAKLFVNANNVTLANNITLNGTTTNGAIYSGDLGTGNVTNLSGQITLNATSNVSNWWNARTLQLSGKITGAGGLNFDRQGSGVGGRYYITAAANDYAGATSVTGSATPQFGYTGQAMLYLGATNALPTTTTLTLNNADLYLNGQSQTLPSISGSGSFSVQNGSTTAATLTLGSGDTTSIFSGSIKDNGLSVSYTAADTATTPTLTTGTVALTKIGNGTLTLSGANTYTGNTTVSAGTLALADNAQLKLVLGTTSGSNNNISGAGTVTLEGDFVIDTTAADALPSGTWTLENVTSLTGAYGANFTVVGFTDAGSNKWTKPNGAKTYTFDETTGILTLAASNTYASWIGTFFPGESNPLIIGADADPDNDGIDNGVEMVLGGNPATGMDTALLPTIELVNADPDGDTTFSNYLLFTYRRTAVSETALVAAACETDTDLVGLWSTAINGASGVVILKDINFTFTPPAPANTDRVRVYVPRGANTKLFGRLNVVVP